MRYFKIQILSAILAFHATSLAQVSEWSIKKDHWDINDEAQYSRFVQSIGLSACGSVDECMKSAANFLKEGDRPDYTWKADCGKLPYVLRAYFSWKNHLPFSYVAQTQVIEPTATKDERYSDFGSTVVSRNDLNQKSPGPVDFYQEIDRLINTVSSASMRTNGVGAAVNLQPDFYPVAISRAGIKPGTNLYDPDGHVAVVYEVTPDGRVLFMDAHPDQSLSRGTYSNKFARSSSGIGSGFKNFRPLWLTNGKILALPNEVLTDFSLDQYNSKISGDINYYEYVRRQLFSNEKISQINPISELKEMIKSICVDANNRVQAVNLAQKAGVAFQLHPDRLPFNIFAATGDWENYATASRDARLKMSYLELRDKAVEYISRVKNHDSFMDYANSKAIKRDMKKSIEKSLRACTINYKDSNDRDKYIDLVDVMDNLYKMSYDPFDCVEHRWGSNSTSCRDDNAKVSWYQSQQIFRFEIGRHPEWKMGQTLEQLLTVKISDYKLRPGPIDLDVFRAIDDAN